ncbi:MAG: complex I NDUFA9 subunit family protein [Verrucomicrobiota bacterium]|nr:complex I NDUFA9 subunit family protein [Limisphaera sp.]MDW8381527.1 complex I NDUFA9 subunit family protein [Verrucomicrobiota bacterium]
MNVLVTGATGFVGQAVVQRLQDQGHTVRALVRDPRSSRARRLVETASVSLFAGSVLDAAAVRTAATDADAIVHLVGIIRECGDQTFENLHVRATLNVVQAARTAGVRRLVHVSALGTRADAPSRYHRTKWEGEENVRASGLEWTILRPSLIYGPGDQFINLFERISRYSPVLFLVGRRTSRFQPVFVNVVACCAAGAVLHPEVVHKTLDVCGPERLTLQEMLRTMLEITGRRRWLVPLPAPVARGLAVFLEAFCPRVLRRPPLLNRDQLLMLEEDNVGDPSLMERFFELRQPLFREGLQSWLRPAAHR